MLRGVSAVPVVIATARDDERLIVRLLDDGATVVGCDLADAEDLAGAERFTFVRADVTDESAVASTPKTECARFAPSGCIESISIQPSIQPSNPKGEACGAARDHRQRK